MLIYILHILMRALIAYCYHVTCSLSLFMFIHSMFFSYHLV